LGCQDDRGVLICVAFLEFSVFALRPWRALREKKEGFHAKPAKDAKEERKTTREISNPN